MQAGGQGQRLMTLVRPALEYASRVWDPHHATLISDLEAVQRRAARFVSNDYRSRSPGCVTAMLDRLKWETLQERRSKQRLMMCYKIRNQLVDLDLSQFYTPGDSRTRSGHRIRKHRTTRDVYHFSFGPRSVHDWNALPEDITTAQSMEDFRARLHQMLWNTMDI